MEYLLEGFSQNGYIQKRIPTTPYKMVRRFLIISLNYSPKRLMFFEYRKAPPVDSLANVDRDFRTEYAGAIEAGPVNVDTPVSWTDD